MVRGIRPGEMVTMIEIGVAGARNSGKTTLIEKLVPELLARGAKVATIKHTNHDHTFDAEGKDSYRHRRAGADLTVAVSDTELALFAPPDKRYLESINELIAACFDICLVEGDKRSDRAKLFLTRDMENLGATVPDNIIATYGGKTCLPELPHFQLGEIVPLGEFIMERCHAVNSGSANHA